MKRTAKRAKIKAINRAKKERKKRRWGTSPPDNFDLSVPGFRPVRDALSGATGTRPNSVLEAIQFAEILIENNHRNNNRNNNLYRGITIEQRTPAEIDEQKLVEMSREILSTVNPPPSYVTAPADGIVDFITSTQFIRRSAYLDRMRGSLPKSTDPYEYFPKKTKEEILATLPEMEDFFGEESEEMSSKNEAYLYSGELVSLG
jgi:hypothetical protein